MRAVRWLGAFGRGQCLLSAGAWEISQRDRQVAAEPLLRGKSRIDHARIGLEIDVERSIFVKGFVNDAWTTAREDGTLAHDRHKPIRKWDRLAKAMRQHSVAKWHAEAVFDLPVYSAVIVKRHSSERAFARAQKLADSLSLPLKILEV
jgi:hypothetical protein